MFKPRLRRTETGWSCIGLGHEGNGATPRGAWFDWLNEAGFYPYV